MNRIPSVMTHSFSKVPNVSIPRSSFNRSFGHKTTFDAGYLIPIFLDEALPGDTFNVKMHALARLATPLKPIMDNMFMETFFFAVPYRLVWDNWKRFNGEQVNPGDSTSFAIPTLLPGAAFTTGSLHDYFGLPIGVANIPGVSCLFHRAYHLIWNEWFRDENLQLSKTATRNDGPDVHTIYQLARRGKRHDYFTSCLPWPQKGESVLVPLGDIAPVVNSGTFMTYAENAAGTLNPTATTRVAAGANTAVNVQAAGTAGALLWYKGGLQADLSSATAATINQLREAFQVQRLFERDARGGTRYTEILHSHFGVTSPDARLQRPEYLGGGSSAVVVSPVAQTSVTAATPQGNLAAIGTVAVKGHGFTKSFTEHCLLMGLVSVRADLTYQQGLNRMWSRSTRFDFYWPSLSNIGEQAVLNKEIYCKNVAEDEDVFGYQERYAEYRYKPSMVTGLFRSEAVGSLDLWHLSQEFGALPVLGSTFIEDNPPVARILAVPTEPHFLFDSYFDMKCARPMPVYGVPGMIDHF